MSSFYEETRKRKYYINCLSDVQNYLEIHSDAMKRYKLNNQKGLLKLIKAFINRVDEFCMNGDNIELHLDDNGEIK